MPRVDNDRTAPVATILLVEDEPAILAACQRMLEREGHTILAARDGAEALRIAGVHLGKIDLVVTDVDLPTLSGPELYERLRPYRPNARVLYMSGYGVDESVRRGVLDDGARVLAKPFTFEELVSAVRSILMSS